MYSGGMFVFKGILGILFGLLLIFLPRFTLGAFLTLFGFLLIAAGVVAFLFAVTSRQTDTMFWFMVSGGIVILGILAFFIPGVFAAIFALAIAGWALITGLWDLETYICGQKRFYLIIAGLTGISLALIAATFYFLPSSREDYLIRMFGFYAAVFGIFSFTLGEMILRGRVLKCLLPVPPKP